MNNEIVDAKSNYEKLVADAKENFLKSEGAKLSSPDTDSKSYWKIIKSFLRTSKYPSIPPLLHVGKYVSDIQEKCNIFNNFFADQCKVLNTGSYLPTFSLLTTNKLSKVVLTKNFIRKIIANLNVKKANGHDEISVKLIKICGESIIDPLYIILENCLQKGVFPKIWKQANVVPIHKKIEKTLL